MGLWARIRAWFRPVSSVAAPAPAPAVVVAEVRTPRREVHVPEVELSLAEEELFEREPTPVPESPRPHESGFRLKTGAQETGRRMPALQTRYSPFDAATRRVDLDEIAKAMDERAASSARGR